MLRAPTMRSFARAPWPLLFAMAGVGLVLSAQGAGHAALPSFCGTGAARLLSTSDWFATLRLAFAINSPAGLLVDWALMLLAMMPPLLAMPLMHVWRSSLPRRRLRSLACFVLGYGFVWMAAGPILMGLALLLRLAAGEGAPAFALLLAITWSASPWQRAALNRCHRLTRIGLFGWAADRECLTFGMIHAVWCTASCWAWMLVPLATERWHAPAMMLTAAIVLSERLAVSDWPRWHQPRLVSLFDPRPILRLRRGAGHG
jgi:predicted metal-binding membrane protein